MSSPQMYFDAGCVSMRPHLRNPVFVDLCCGSKSMADQACRMVYITVVTVDNVRAWDPSYSCDILDIDEGHPFLQELDGYVKEGRQILFHASPPCNDFSKLKTTVPRNIERGMAIVRKCWEIMSKYSTVYTLENPATGLLWKQPWAKDNFKYYHDLDYCRYGALMRKRTRIVFSSSAFRDLIVPRLCKGNDKCLSAFKNPLTNRMCHTSINSLPHKQRICIPPQLCVVLMSAFREMADQLASGLADDLDRMIAAAKNFKRAAAVNYAENRQHNKKIRLVDLAAVVKELSSIVDAMASA